MKMSIAFITPEFITEPNSFDGGLANYLFRVTKALNRLGHKTVVIVASKEDIYLTYEEIEIYRVNVNSRLIKMLNKLTRHRYSYVIKWIYQSWILNRALNRISREYKFDIVQYASYKATGFFRNKKIPSVVRISAYQPILMSFYGSTQGSREIKQVEYLERMCFKRSDGLFAPSKLMAGIIQDLIHEKVEVIESPYELEFEEKDFSVYNKLFSGKKYLLFYGSVGPLKGVDLIANVIEEFLDNYRDFYFVFIGKDMKYRDKPMIDYVYSCAGLFKDRIIYHDRLNHQQLFPIVRNAYAVVLPSKIDNLPNTCIEAMSLNKLVIGTKGASFEQLIDDGINGFLCQNNSASDLMNTINKVMNLDLKDKLKIEDEAGNRIHELKPEKTVNRLLDFYQKVIEQNTGGRSF